MQPRLTIRGRAVGGGASVYIIAELSANHHQEIGEAIRLIEAAKAAGADAVKLQTYTPDTMTIRAPQAHFRIGAGSPWEGRDLYDLYAEAATPWEWHPVLKKHADDLGIHLFSSPFDATAVEFLERLDVPAFKVASFEIVDVPLIRRLAKTGKPIILSTGMASADEIGEAIQTIRDEENDQIALLKCTSAYPAPYTEMNLRTIPAMIERFGLPVGLSDHSLELVAPAVAVALGACIIEKHLTLSRATPGPDSSFSLEPREFTEMVVAVRKTEQALGGIHYGPTMHEVPNLAFRRSLFAVRDIAAGELLTPENIRSIRPSCGLPPKFFESILGRRSARPIPRGTPLSWDEIEGGTEQ